MENAIARVALPLLTCCLVAVPCLAEDRDVEVSFDGDVRTRWEYVSNLFDAQDHDDATQDDDFDFFPYRVRFGLDATFREDVSGRVSIQNFGYFGNDFGGPTETFQDPIGQSARLSQNNSEIDLYEGYVQLAGIGESRWSLRVGRAEHALGNELHLGNSDFYNGTTFDGVRATADWERFDLDLFHYVTNDESVNTSFNSVLSGGLVPFGDDDLTISGAAFDISIGKQDRNIEPYLLVARDNDFSLGGFDVRTLGLLFDRTVTSDDDVDDGPFDWSIELALQSGDFEPAGGDLDVSASILEGWVGYSWLHGDARSRVHVGILQASGDDDPLDSELEAFVPLFPDHHAFNRLGNLDLFGGPSVVTAGLGTDNPLGQSNVALAGGLSNVEDFNIGYAIRHRQERHHLAVSVHRLSLSEAVQSGVVEDEIGIEIDVVYELAYSDRVGIQGGLSSLSAGDALDELTQGAFGRNADDIVRLWWQLELGW